MHTFKTLFLGLASASLLTACAVGRDYETPVSNTPAHFSHANHPEFSAHDIEVSWWKLFHDAELNALVEQTITHNYDLQAAQANLREARELYLQAGLNLLPVVTSHANYSEQERSTGALNNKAFVPRDLKLYNTGFDAFWEIDFFGRVRRNNEASHDEIEAQEASLRDVGVSVVAEVARNYFELRGLQNQLTITEQNIRNQAQILELIQIKVKNGRGTAFDVESANAQLENTRATLPNLIAAIHQAMHRLSVLTGQLPTALTQKLSIPAALPIAPEIINIGNPAQLLRRRSDIRLAERSLAAATARIGVATADLFPRVTFVGNLSLESTLLSGLAAAGSQSYSFGPRISWSAFDLGRVYSRIKAADAQAESSLAKYEQSVLIALEETENALLNYNQARERRALLASAFNSSEQANKIARLRYQEGVTDFMSVLDSELRLLQTQTQLAQSETTTATALAALYKALGGGWEIMF